MAKITDIIAQLQAVLPKKTDKFHDEFSIAGITSIGGGVFEIETSSVHGLSVGDYITIKDVISVNPISSVSLDSGVVTATTTVYHDLTSTFHETINLSGFSNVDDGDYPLLAVPTGLTFTFANEDLPTGSGQLNEDRIDGINGRYAVTAITNTTKFRVSSTTVFTSFEVTSGKVVSGIRVSGFVSEDLIEKYYTEHSVNEYWAFVIPQPTTTSFDRRIQSDAVQKKQKSDELFIECINPFSVYVVAPAINTIGGRYISDDMVDIRIAICKSLVGVKFDSGFTESDKYITTYLADGFFNYVGAYYVHKFDFENVYQFSQEDAVDLADSVAFRRFEIDIKMKFDDYGLVKKSIDGDLPV